jgi:hypothetical protein
MVLKRGPCISMFTKKKVTTSISPGTIMERIKWNLRWRSWNRRKITMMISMI